jgi:hypothetical protein
MPLLERLAMRTTDKHSKLVIPLVVKVILVQHIPLSARDLNEQVIS